MSRCRKVEYKWKCPFCPAVGRKWLTSREARKCGRNHIRNIHNGKSTPKITSRKIRQ